jgi:hypothetical protein
MTSQGEAVNLSALPELLIAWFKNQGAELLQTGRGQGQARLPFKPGGQYEGKVLDQAAGGRSLVKVGQTVLDMALPKNVGTGETVRLTYLNASPRPTFLLSRSGAVQAPTPVRLNGVAPQVDALIRLAQAPPTPEVATPTTMVGQTPASAANPAQTLTAAQTASAAASPSQGQAAAQTAAVSRPIVPNAAMLLNSAPMTPASVSTAAFAGTAVPAMAMTGQAVEGLRAALAPGTTMSPQGVVSSQLPDSHLLPQRLKQVVMESGMFYESHLSRWVKGEGALANITREPQARLPETGSTPTGIPELKDMPDQAARMAGRQLMILEGAPFVWQGQAWPGQDLEWLIEERQERQGSGAGEQDAPQWRTELRLTLPRLGVVHAAVGVHAKGLDVRIAAVSDATLTEIRAALPRLEARLRAARLNVRAVDAGLTHGEG